MRRKKKGHKSSENLLPMVSFNLPKMSFEENEFPMKRLTRVNSLKLIWPITTPRCLFYCLLSHTCDWFFLNIDSAWFQFRFQNQMMKLQRRKLKISWEKIQGIRLRMYAQSMKQKDWQSSFGAFLIRVRGMYLAKPKNEDHVSYLSDSHLA